MTLGASRLSPATHSRSKGPAGVAHELFGVHPTHGTIRVDHCGALVLVIGGPVRALTADARRPLKRASRSASVMSSRQGPNWSQGAIIGRPPKGPPDPRDNPRGSLRRPGPRHRWPRPSPHGRCHPGASRSASVMSSRQGPNWSQGAIIGRPPKSGSRQADALRRAESDPGHLPAALTALDGLAPLDRRTVLASLPHGLGRHRGR
jgi:hypothetical protein